MPPAAGAPGTGKSRLGVVLAAVAQRLEYDAFGFAGGDVNLYAYVGNDPVGATDPTGLAGFGGPLDSRVAAVAATCSLRRAIFEAADIIFR